MNKQSRVWAVAVVGLALASGVAWWLQQPGATTASTQAGGAPAGQAPSGRPGGGPGGPGGPGAMPAVEVATVNAVRLVDEASAVGSLRSHQSVMLRPEVSGRVVRIGFADGARVRRGQLMFQLDDTLQQAELSQAQAQLSIVRANLQRNQDLVAQGFVAQRVLDESRASLQVAEAQVQLAQARVGRMRITAPFDGVVGIRNISVGDYVREGADLVAIEDLSSMVVDFRLPEREQARIRQGQVVSVQLDALPGVDLTARVQAADPVVDANGRAVLVRAVLQPSDAALRSGLFARVNVVMEVRDNALMVPEEAVVPVAGRQVVFKLVQEQEGDTTRSVVRRTDVSLGLRRGAMVQVLNGLQAGDTVVVAGQQRLQRDGMPVRVVDLNRPSGPPATPAAPARPQS